MIRENLLLQKMYTRTNIKKKKKTQHRSKFKMYEIFYHFTSTMPIVIF